MTEPTSDSVCGRVDRDGRLLSADSRLLALQLGAGGEANGVLAVPQLASLARLARTLGILVSRSVKAADGNTDLELLVRAQPEGEEVRLAISGWTALEREGADAATLADRAKDLAVLGGDGTWETDGALRLISIDPGLSRHAGLSDKDWRGRRLMSLFELVGDDGDESALLAGVLDRVPFSGQRALVLGRDDLEIWLHGAPNGSGFAGGYRWATAPLVENEPAKEIAAFDDPEFPARLETALRPPLARIIADADAIAGEADGPIATEYAGYGADIANAGRHLLGLVDDIADLHAVEAPGFVIPAERVDLADVARRAAGILAVRASDNRVRIDAPTDDEELWSQGDFRRALQIMVNLIGNAVRYSPTGSMVWIRVEQLDDLAAIIVADQGKGIARDDQERIFEKFERVDPTEPGGNGLGLYISRRLARAMGGDLTVDSAPGMGARFALTLPSAAVPDAPASPD